MRKSSNTHETAQPVPASNECSTTTKPASTATVPFTAVPGLQSLQGEVVVGQHLAKLRATLPA